MIKFEDGPAKGVVLMLQRAPVFLRVVRNGSEFDALDLIEDEPKPAETIYVYKTVSQPTVCFIDGQDPKTRKRFGQRCAIASYRFVEQQPRDSDMRSNTAWQAWCEIEGPKIIEEMRRAGGLSP